jgi:hypothetical protein
MLYCSRGQRRWIGRFVKSARHGRILKGEKRQTVSASQRSRILSLLDVSLVSIMMIVIVSRLPRRIKSLKSYSGLLLNPFITAQARE